MSEDQKQYELRPVDNLPVEATPNAVIMMAMQKGYTPELIKQMMDLQERFEKNEARKAYHDAMSRFKENPPEIEKDRTVSFGAGKTSYKHASLANVTTKINKALSDHGLSAGWHTEQTEKGITVTCTITHRQGHSESTSLTAGADTSGSKNAIQAIGSTVSYLERYTILSLTGLATYDMDDDGQNAETTEFITEAQVKEINDLLAETSADVSKFLKVAKAESVETISVKMYPMLIKQLKTKKDKMRQPGE